MLTHSPAGIGALHRASAVFLTHGTSDYPFLRLPRHALIIQAYHGLPTKRGEYMRPSGRKPGYLHRKILEYRFGPITHFISSSPLVTELFSSRFNIPPDRFIQTGYPAYEKIDATGPAYATEPADRSIHAAGRNTVKNSSGRLSAYWPEAPESDKLILYAPTFRRKKRTRWFPFNDMDPGSLAAFLEEKKALLALRSHPNENPDLDRYHEISPRIVSGNQKIAEDVLEILPMTDLIMTDYSSIYLEGLLLDIPVVFLPYDLETYERGLQLPFEQISPGPKVFTQKEMLQQLDRGLKRTDKAESERKRVRELYFASSQVSATDRVIRFLEDQLL